MASNQQAEAASKSPDVLKPPLHSHRRQRETVSSMWRSLWLAVVYLHLSDASDAKSSEDVGGLTSAAFLQTVLEAQSYDNRIYPGFEKHKPTNVTVRLVMDSIDSVDETSMDFTSNFIITQEWYDRRLRFHSLIGISVIELDSKMINSVWVPDLYFANEKRAIFHDVTVPNIMMHISNKGFVKYKSRVSLTAACPMNLQKFPLDSQKCSLQLKSFAYTKKIVNFHWRDENPVEAKSFELPQFRLTKLEAGHCENDTTNSDEGDFSCIQVNFYMERQIGYYMIQLYIPSILIVSLSWVSFWLTIEAVPARISLGILTVLTMTTQKSSAGVSLPRVSYVKAIDVWMAICMIFVFSALLEFALVNVLSRREKKNAHSMRNPDRQFSSTNETILMVEENHGTKPRNDMHWSPDIKGIKQARTLDKLSRVFFPVAYGLFCALYWIFYTKL